MRIKTKCLVCFCLCPSGYCSDDRGIGCKEGYSDYIVDTNEYVNDFMQMKEEYEEQKCEAYADARYFNCDDNDDEEGCLNARRRELIL